MEEFRTYNKASFPLIFSYPKPAIYIETTKKKYSSQVCLRERKEKFERKTPEEIETERKANIGAGLLKSVFPKLVVTYFKVYVPAYQSSTSAAYFMTMDQYMKFKMWADMKIFPNATYDKINLSFGEGEIITFRGESMDYYRSEALIGDKDDDRQFLSILYRHIGRYHSFDELNIIMDSVKKRE
jgi:hypothetical protein